MSGNLRQPLKNTARMHTAATSTDWIIDLKHPRTRLHQPPKRGLLPHRAWTSPTRRCGPLA